MSARRSPRSNRGQGKAIAFIRAHADYQGDDCVMWPFARMPNGYGHFGFESTMYYSHRYMCQLTHGEPPTPKHHAAHSCHRRACINPRHLDWKTLSQNMLDKRDNGTVNVAWWGRKGKLTAVQAAEILSLKGRDTQRRIAARFGITESNVRNIHTGKTWAVRIAELTAVD